MRKDADLQISDRIKVELKSSKTLWNLISNNISYISGETLANSVVFSEDLSLEFKQEHDIDGETVTLGIEKFI